MRQLVLILSLTIGSHLAMADTFYLPKSMDHNFNNRIRVQNNAETINHFDLYIKHSHENSVSIENIAIEASQSRFLKLSDWIQPNDIAWIKPSLSSGTSLHFSLLTPNGEIALPKQVSNNWRGNINNNAAQLVLQSHSHLKSAFAVKFADKNGNLIKSTKWVADSFGSTKLQIPINSEKIEINSEFRSLAYLSLANGKQDFLEAYKPTYKDYPPKGVRFLVEHSQPLETKSYIVMLKDPEKIEMARKIIASPMDPNLPRIICGKVEKGHAEYNKDWKNKLQTNWSWHLSNIEFVGRALNEYDTNPQLVEEFLYEFEGNRDRICPWNYRLKSEMN